MLVPALAPTLALAPWMLNLGYVLLVVIGILLVLTVLIQRPQGGGLSGAFGAGAGSGQTAFGAKTGDALTWFTIVMFAVWIVLAVLLNYAARPAPPAPPTPQVSAPPGAPAPSADPATPQQAAPPEASTTQPPSPAQPTAPSTTTPETPAAPAPATPEKTP